MFPVPRKADSQACAVGLVALAHGQFMWCRNIILKELGAIVYVARLHTRGMLSWELIWFASLKLNRSCK